MRLQLQEIGEALPRVLDAGPEPDEVPGDAHDLWRDSTLELERGLDVVELPLDAPELPADLDLPNLPDRP